MCCSIWMDEVGGERLAEDGVFESEAERVGAVGWGEAENSRRVGEVHRRKSYLWEWWIVESAAVMNRQIDLSMCLLISAS